MKLDAKNGVFAGLIVGALFGILLQITDISTPAGRRISMMALIAQSARSSSAIIGWAYHLFDCAIIGAIFGALLGPRSRNYGEGFRNGALYGLGWWALGGIILMPFLLAMSVFSPQNIAPFPGLAMKSLIGHVVFGALIGPVFVALKRRDKAYRVSDLEREERPPHLKAG